MKLSDFFEKYVRVFTCNDLIIIGEVIDYYPAIGTESGEDIEFIEELLSEWIL